MHYILVIILNGATVFTNSASYADYPTYAACNAALSSMKINNPDGYLAYCQPNTPFQRDCIIPKYVHDQKQHAKKHNL